MADEAKFALRSLLVDYGVVLSSPADSRHAIAHESRSPIGFLNIAKGDSRAARHGGFAALKHHVHQVSRIGRARTSTHIESVAALWDVVKLRGTRL
jgi:hypothetical protein